MNKIIHVFDVKSSKQSVYGALTTQRGLAGWWTTEVTAQIQVGGRIDFRFGDVFHPVMEVLRLDPWLAVEWKCVAGEKDWQDGRFMFALEDRNGMTLVRFTQDYARELDDDVYGRFNFTWAYYLQSLKELCETGKGFPFEAA